MRRGTRQTLLTCLRYLHLGVAGKQTLSIQKDEIVMCATEMRAQRLNAGKRV